MKKSLQNYIHNVGGFIDRNSPLLRDADNHADVVIEEKLPALTVVTSEKLNENIVVEDQEILLTEEVTANLPVETESTNNELLESLRDSIDGLKIVLEEQQNTQLTSKTLLETTEKLSQISVREINVPAPVVNVSLTEQKKIIKTVDRDSNGLIRQITEETEQSVSK